MFFKHILIAFIIIGILGFIYGDHLFYFQANLMIGWQYDFPAFESFERIVRYYPNSQYKAEAVKMMDLLLKRNGDLRGYIEKRDKGLKKLQQTQAEQEGFR